MQADVEERRAQNVGGEQDNQTAPETIATTSASKVSAVSRSRSGCTSEGTLAGVITK